MMIEKIVSGGQTGADQGALDAAIDLGIPHGGWIPRGRKTENGPLPERYRLREMPSSGYAERTEKNVVDADGTVILSHGPLTGGSLYTRKMAIRHERPWIHLDLNRNSEFEAAMILSKWIWGQGIRVLNVAGPRASKDPSIHQATVDILESAVFLLQMGSHPPAGAERPAGKPPAPRTVDEAVAALAAGLSLKERATIANMTAAEIGGLRPTLGEYLHDTFGLGAGNDALLASCRFVSGKRSASGEDAAMVIIRSLWDRLRQTHRLRLV